MSETSASVQSVSFAQPPEKRILAIVGVLSDSHIPFRVECLPQAVWDYLRGSDYIVHAGDLEDPELITQLSQIAPVTAVAGNIHWQYATGIHDQDLPMSQTLTIGQQKIWVTHGHLVFGYALYDKLSGAFGFVKSLFKPRPKIKPKSVLEAINIRLIERMHPKRPANCTVVIFGHSHKPTARMKDGVLYFNPGSVIGAEGEPTPPSIGRLTFFTDNTIKHEWLYW